MIPPATWLLQSRPREAREDDAMSDPPAGHLPFAPSEDPFAVEHGGFYRRWLHMIEDVEELKSAVASLKGTTDDLWVPVWREIGERREREAERLPEPARRLFPRRMEARQEKRMPAVSVVIPAYNQGAFIGEAIRSVLEQTFRDFDVHVIDDGSTDDTKEVVESFDDERLRYFRQENSGLPAVARNVGIARSTGEFIAFLDADDLWLPDKLERQAEAMKANPNCGIVACNFQCLGDHPLGGKVMLRGNVPTGRVFEKLLHANFICTAMAMVRRSALQKAGVFDPSLRIGEDYDLWLRITHDFEFEHVEKVCGFYRINKQSITEGNSPLVWIPALISVVERICEMYHIPRKLADSALAVHYARQAFHYLRAGDAESFRGAIRRSAGRRMTMPLAGLLLGRALLGANGLIRLFEFLRSRGFRLPHTYRR